MSAGAAASSAAAVATKQFYGKNPNWKDMLIAFLITIGVAGAVLGIILLIAWYAGNI